MGGKLKLKWEWFLIIFLFAIIVAGGIFHIIKTDNISKAEIIAEQNQPKVNKIETKEDKLLKRCEKLELAYNSAIDEIESVVADDDINLAILKENLTQILLSIKKERISRGGSDSLDYTNSDSTKKLSELLNISKEVLAERVLEVNEDNKNLTIDNRKLYQNLKKLVNWFNKEKSKNIQLKEEVGQIRARIQTLEFEGLNTSREIKLLNEEKSELEKKLVESNKTIKIQNEQIVGLGEIMRKVNIDCYYVFQKGHPIEETKIYLTSQGISEKYVKYFIRKKPDICVEFKLAKDLFGDEIGKIELKLYNASGVEIYSVVKAISSEHIKIVIPNKNFATAKYSIALKAGDKDLILDERYWLKISK